MDNSNCCVENHVGRQTVSQLEPFVLRLSTRMDGRIRSFTWTPYNGSDNDDNDIPVRISR